MRHIELLQMDNKESIGEYFTRILALTNWMETYDVMVKDLIVIKKIICALPFRFNYIVVAIEESKELAKRLLIIYKVHLKLKRQG